MKFFDVHLPPEGAEGPSLATVESQAIKSFLGNQHFWSDDFSDSSDDDLYFSAEESSEADHGSHVLVHLQTKHEHSTSVSHLDNNDKDLISGDSNGTVILWNFDTMEELKRVEAEQYIISLSVSLPYVATCGHTECKILNLETGQVRDFVENSLHQPR